MEIRSTRIDGRVELRLVHAKHTAEKQNLEIKDRLLAVLDLCDGTSADVQAFDLKLGGKLLLRPSALTAESSHLRPYDVAVVHLGDAATSAMRWAVYPDFAALKQTAIAE